MDLNHDPFKQFQCWLDEALAAGGADPRAMALATAGRDGLPSARIVILRGFDQEGFVFYTDYESPKARDLAENPRAALVFSWPSMERQVRLSGPVERVSRDQSEQYFRTRPRDAQLAAWVPQSRRLDDRQALEEQVRAREARYASGEVPLPPFWGGYRVAPDSFEFWQERPDRLHDRVRYRRQANRDWVMERLTP